MQITLSPVRLDETLTASLAGDTLTLNGEDFDFSPLQEGDTLPAAAIESDWFAGDVERIDGELHLTLRFPHGWNASEALRFPEPIHMTGDGPVPFPTDAESDAEPEAPAND